MKLRSTKHYIYAKWCRTVLRNAISGLIVECVILVLQIATAYNVLISSHSMHMINPVSMSSIPFTLTKNVVFVRRNMGTRLNLIMQHHFRKSHTFTFTVVLKLQLIKKIKASKHTSKQNVELNAPMHIVLRKSSTESQTPNVVDGVEFSQVSRWRWLSPSMIQIHADHLNGIHAKWKRRFSYCLSCATQRK